MGFVDDCNIFWCKIIQSFNIGSDNTLQQEISATEISSKARFPDVKEERNVDMVAQLLESIMSGAESLGIEEQYCPVKPGFVKDLVEGAKGSAN